MSVEMLRIGITHGLRVRILSEISQTWNASCRPTAEPQEIQFNTCICFPPLRSSQYVLTGQADTPGSILKKGQVSKGLYTKPPFLYLSILLPILSQLGKLRLRRDKTLCLTSGPNCFPPQGLQFLEFMLHNLACLETKALNHIRSTVTQHFHPATR